MDSQSSSSEVENRFEKILVAERQSMGKNEISKSTAPLELSTSNTMGNSDQFDGTAVGNVHHTERNLEGIINSDISTFTDESDFSSLDTMDDFDDFGRTLVVSIHQAGGNLESVISSEDSDHDRDGKEQQYNPSSSLIKSRKRKRSYDADEDHDFPQTRIATPVSSSPPSVYPVTETRSGSSQPLSMFDGTGFLESDWEKVVNHILEFGKGGIKLREKFSKVFYKTGAIRPAYSMDAKFLVESRGYDESQKETLMTKIFGGREAMRWRSTKAPEKALGSYKTKRHANFLKSSASQETHAGEVKKDRQEVTAAGNDAELSATLSQNQQRLTKKLRKKSFTLTEKQKEVLNIVLGPPSERHSREPRVFNRAGQIFSGVYGCLLYLQDSAGRYLISEALVKEVFKSNKRPSAPIFRSVDKTNFTFERIGAEIQVEEDISIGFGGEDAKQGTTVTVSDRGQPALELSQEIGHCTSCASDTCLCVRSIDENLTDLPGNSRSASSDIVEDTLNNNEIERIPARRNRKNDCPEINLTPAKILGRRRCYVPQDFICLKAVKTDLDQIDAFVSNSYGVNSDLKNPDGYKPFREYPVLRQHDYLHGTGSQLPVIRVLRAMLCTPGDMRLEERVKSLSLENMPFPDLMKTLVTYWIFEKLSKIVFFPEASPCLNAIRLLKDNESFSDLRKIAIMDESKSYTFNDRCKELAHAWALEANVVLSPLMGKFEADGICGYDERATLKSLEGLIHDMLRLHARFEAEASSIEYFWPNPEEPFDEFKHERDSRREIIQFTKRFGVKLLDKDGRESVFVKAQVRTMGFEAL